MKLSKAWRRLLLTRNHTAPAGCETDDAPRASCFISWMRAYRERLLPAEESAASDGRISVVALVVSDEDRQVLTRVAQEERLEIHFPNSRVEAWDAMNRWNAPVILYDRDWPNAEWRTTVRTFAAAPQHSCVILACRVADDSLWQELIRYGGYDLLPKPFRVEDVTRALRLASSYWRSGRSAPQF